MGLTNGPTHLPCHTYLNAHTQHTSSLREPQHTASLREPHRLRARREPHRDARGRKGAAALAVLPSAHRQRVHRGVFLWVLVRVRVAVSRPLLLLKRRLEDERVQLRRPQTPASGRGQQTERKRAGAPVRVRSAFIALHVGQHIHWTRRVRWATNAHPHRAVGCHASATKVLGRTQDLAGMVDRNQAPWTAAHTDKPATGAHRGVWMRGKSTGVAAPLHVDDWHR